MIRNYELIRNIRAGDLLESFLVCAVATILTTRFFLFLTNYPKLGGDGFHIAHVLWGGLLMLFSIVILLSFVGKNARNLGVILGGVGFGLFIDELGKFITSDNNYFYQPTIAFIYLIFLALFFLFRFVERYKQLSAKEYLMNALILLEEAILNDMDKDEKDKYQKFLINAGDFHYLTKQLQSLSEKLAIHEPKQNSIVRFYRLVFGYFDSFLKSNLFQKLIIILFLGHFLIVALTTVFIIVARFQNTPYIINPVPEEYIFLAVGEFVSTIVAAVLAVLGVILLPVSKFKAYLLFKYAVLVTILLTTFFSFYRVQLSAIFGLLINILLLSGLNNMLSQYDVSLKKKIK